MVVCGGLKDSGADGSRETYWRNYKHTQISFAKFERRGTLGDLDIGEIIHTM
jgi:hypothetical protein